MLRDFTIAGKAKSTFNNYIRCLAHIALHYKISPEKLDTEQVKDYLYFCKEQHQTPSDSFFKHTVYGLRSAYKSLGINDKTIALPQIPKNRKLPIVLNRREIRELLFAPKYQRHKMMLGLLYGCGLRSYELCKLKVADVDLERQTLYIAAQKGKHDRFIPLSHHLVRGLQTYITSEKPQEYLFNSQVSTDGKPHPITTRAVFWLIKEIRSKVNTSKKFTAHSLRHSYATHLLEDGLDILSLQKRLGHARIETTLMYLHISQLEKVNIISPLDKVLGTDEKS